MIYNPETGHFHIVIMDGACIEEGAPHFTSDNVIFDQTYSLEYRISGKEHRPCKIKFSGEELTVLASRCFGLIKPESDLYEIKKSTAHIVEFWADYTIHGRIRPHLRESCHTEVFPIMKGAFKGQRQNVAWMRSCIAGYLYTQITLENKTRDFTQGTTLLLHDCSLTSEQMQDLLLDGKWKEQPITKRLNITSFEGFMALINQGTLTLEWLNRDGSLPLEAHH